VEVDALNSSERRSKVRAFGGAGRVKELTAGRPFDRTSASSVESLRARGRLQIRFEKIEY